MSNHRIKKEAMRECCLIIFKPKSGKIVNTYEAVGFGALKLMVVDSLQKNKDAIICYKDTGDVIWYIQGGENYPKVFEDNLGNLEDYCPGLLAALQSA